MSFIHVPAIRGKCPAPTLFGASIRARGRRQGRWDGARSRARPIAVIVSAINLYSILGNTVFYHPLHRSLEDRWNCGDLDSWRR